MNKEEIVEIIAAKHGISKAKTRKILRTFLGTVQDTVVRGERVTLTGFGSFVAQLTEPRIWFNPKTSEKVHIEAKRRPKFFASGAFLTAVDSANTAADEEQVYSGTPDERLDEFMEN